MCGIVGYLRTPKPIGSFDLNELEDFLTELVAKDSSNISQAEQLSLNGFAGKLIGVEGIVALVRQLLLSLRRVQQGGYDDRRWGTYNEVHQ